MTIRRYRGEIQGKEINISHSSLLSKHLAMIMRLLAVFLGTPVLWKGEQPEMGVGYLFHSDPAPPSHR